MKVEVDQGDLAGSGPGERYAEVGGDGGLARPAFRGHDADHSPGRSLAAVRLGDVPAAAFCGFQRAVERSSELFVGDVGIDHVPDAALEGGFPRLRRRRGDDEHGDLGMRPVEFLGQPKRPVDGDIRSEGDDFRAFTGEIDHHGPDVVSGLRTAAPQFPVHRAGIGAAHSLLEAGAVGGQGYSAHR